MKNLYLIIILTLTFSFLLMPIIAVESPKSQEKISLGTSSSTEIKESTFEKIDEFKVYNSKTKEVEKIKAEEYILGVVAAEIGADSSKEALKAQGLAAYTFAYKRHLQNSKASLEYDLTDDFSLDQAYLNEDGRAEKWGDKTKENEEKILLAIKEIKNLLIVYNKEPILAAYHAISPGNTESAKNVWGSDYPYLQSVSSAYDLLSPNYLSEVRAKTTDFTKKITALGANPEGSPAKYIGKATKTSAGMVSKIIICGKEFTGSQIREAFGLRSAAFDLSFKDDTFIFTVTGYGHGVGMSQFGANYMAQQGHTYDEIIFAYYKGAEIVSIE